MMKTQLIHYSNDIPRLSVANSIELYGEKFWLERVGTSQVYNVWRVSDKALVVSQRKEKAIELLKERYPCFQKNNTIEK